MVIKKTGLIFNKKAMGNKTRKPYWFLDSSSVESFGSSWSAFGYEIIYRFEEPRTTQRVVSDLKRAFMKPFALTLDHYRFEPTFWRIYWDRGPWEASLLRACEAELDKVAKDNALAFTCNGVIIQPRPMGYIKGKIESNGTG
jgi:hypothetical protein